MRLISHKLLLDMRFMHKCETCNIKGNVSVVEVIDLVYVMASCEPSTVCNGRKCDGNGVTADNMVESEVI